MGLGLIQIYEIGKAINYDLKVENLEKKLSFVFFPYSAKAVVFTSAIFLVGGILLSLLVSPFSGFLSTTIFFFSGIISLVSYLYPFSIFYTHKIMEYSEEMLRAIMHISTYVQTGSSLEYAFMETHKNIHGILKKQFGEIIHSLERKSEMTLGDALNKYVDTWNKVNPQFVKALRLLQIAALSDEAERERLIRETVETIMIDYMVLGKRSAEELSKNTKLLIAGGILLPILSLLILPVAAVFMPELVRPDLVAFVYVVLFPTVVLIAALSFASKRVQVDTIRLEDHKEYTPMPRKYLYLAILIAVVFCVPAIPALAEVLQDPERYLDSFLFFVLAWLLAAGLALSIKTYSNYYMKRYKRIWRHVQEIEQDLPFVLQSFSTYYTLNTPFEKVVDGVIDDYINLGFREHPVVSAFQELKKKIATSKKPLMHILEKESKEIFPSTKIRSVVSQIASFESVSQDSAAKAARTIRQQVINTYKLDDYIKTLLSDTVSLIRISTTMLAPLLCASAVIMTYAILKSLDFITAQLEMITSIFGGQAMDLQLVDTSQVISPIFIAAIIGVYLLEIVIVLSIFQTQINTGNDKYQIFSSVNSNMISFFLYSIILFGGYFFVNIILFQGILAMT